MLPVGEQGPREWQPRACSKGSLGAPLETHGILTGTGCGIQAIWGPR